MNADIVANFNLVCWRLNAYSAEWNTAFRKGLWNGWSKVRLPTEGRDYSLFKSSSSALAATNFLSRGGTPDHLHRVPKLRTRVVQMFCTSYMASWRGEGQLCFTASSTKILWGGLKLNAFWVNTTASLFIIIDPSLVWPWKPRRSM